MPETLDDLWQERDTTPPRVEEALRHLLTERHSASQAVVPARVINLVVIVDADFRGEIENRLRRIGRYHPSRLIICAVRRGQQTLDATATMSAEHTGDDAGRLSVARERVDLELGPQHLRALDTIVDPLVVTDLATLVWAPHGHAEGIDALRRIAQIVLIDSLDEPDVEDALTRADELAQDTYVVDLAWLRSTPWRERVAAAFDPPPLRRKLREIQAVTVRQRQDSAASGMLFLGWLVSRLEWRPERLSLRGDEWRGSVRARRSEVRLRLEVTAAQGAPGLAGVTVELASGEAVSLDRGPGGLRASRRFRGGREQAWTVLGASRGEAGILGEGIRQALLRDPTYRPALAAARALVREESRVSVDTHVLPDAEAVAVAAADRIAAVLSAGGHVALAGGSSPARAYEVLRDRAGDWSGATLWFSDDRAVGPEDELSNCRMAAKALLDHLPEPSRPRVHRVEGELGAEAAADRYEALVRSELGADPSFDLVLLGLGPDAHTASLFPGKPAVQERERLVVAVPEPGMEPYVPRVSFTLPLINAARETVFLVAGEGKAAAVTRAFGEPADSSSPAAHVRPVTVLLDDAAASGLTR